MKVGKAIYNILSQSTDVQSNFPFNTTDYSPTGTELVTNGDFSATGSELVDNNDFSNGTTDWNNEGNSTISVGTHEGRSNVADINITGTSTGDVISHSFSWTEGSSYKVTCDVYVVSGSFRIDSSGSVSSNDFVSSNTLGEWQTLTGYVTSNITGSQDFWLRSMLDGATGEVSQFYVDSVSIKELGEGWNVQEGWSIGEDKAICDGSTNNYVRKVLSLPVGNLKVTFEVDSYTSGTLNLWANLPAFTTIIQATSANTYEAYITTTSGANNLYFYSVAFVGSFTNVTVEEMVLNKIFPELAPPDIDAPYIVYSVVSNSPSETKNTNGDIDTASIEVYGFQDTYNKAVDLGVSVRAALDRKTGTYNTIEIQSTNYVNEQMDVNEARKLWAAIQDYSIRIKNL